MKNLKELVSKIYSICINTNRSITTNSPFDLLEKELTEYSKDLLIEFAKYMHNKKDLGEGLHMMSEVVDFLNESLNQKAFDEKLMEFIEDKKVRKIWVCYKVYERFRKVSKIDFTDSVKDNEIRIEY